MPMKYMFITSCDMIMGHHLEVRETVDTSFLWTAYDASFKLLVIRYAEGTSNCVASRKYSISGDNTQWWMNDNEQLLGASFFRKAFCGPISYSYEEMEW